MRKECVNSRSNISTLYEVVLKAIFFLKQVYRRIYSKTIGEANVVHGGMKKSVLPFLRPKRILLCQQRQIGDVVLATPAVELLRRVYPAAEIHFLTEKKCAGVLENNPNIMKLWLVGKGVPFHKKIKQAFAIRNVGFDLVVDFQQLPRCKRVALISGASIRLSFTPKWYNRFIYTHWVDMFGGYAVKAKMSVLRPLGVEWNLEPPKIFLAEKEKEEAKKYLLECGFDDNSFLITVDSTHWSDTRRWPAAHYAELLARLVEAQPRIRFLLLYGPGERSQALSVYNKTKAKDVCVLPEKEIGLRQTIALIAQAKLHVGNCSAPRHFALAVGTPTFTIVGSNSGKSWTFPAEEHSFFSLGTACSPCNRNTCRRFDIECLRHLSAEKIASKILELAPFRE